MAPTTRSNTGAAPNKGNAGKRTATAAAPKKGSAGGRTAAAAATTKKGAVERSSMSTITRFQLLIYPATSTADVSASPRAEKNIYSCTAGRPRPLWYVQHQRPPTRTKLFHSITFFVHLCPTLLFSSFNPLFCLNKQRLSTLSTFVVILL